MPLFKVDKMAQEEYNADQAGHTRALAALAAEVAMLRKQVAPPRVGGQRIPYTGAVAPVGTTSYSPSAPSASPAGGSGGIIVSDGTNIYQGVTTIIFPGWTITVAGGGVTVTPDFSGIDDS